MSKAPTPGSATPVTGSGPGTQPLTKPPSIPTNLASAADLPPLPPSQPQQQQPTPSASIPQTPTITNPNLVIPTTNGSPPPPQQQQQNHHNNNDDEDDDDDDASSDASSDGYDFQGNVVVRQEMSPRRKQEILERAMKKREEDSSMRIENYIKPLPPRRTAQSIRMRSREILDEAREVIALDIGAPPRVVRDEETGYILPRESVVTVAKPIEVVDEHGNVTLVAAPTTGYGLSKQFDDLQKEKTREDATVTHYARSVEALKYAQQQRLLRQLNIEQ